MRGGKIASERGCGRMSKHGGSKCTGVVLVLNSDIRIINTIISIGATFAATIETKQLRNYMKNHQVGADLMQLGEENMICQCGFRKRRVPIGRYSDKDFKEEFVIMHKCMNPNCLESRKTPLKFIYDPLNDF